MNKRQEERIRLRRAEFGIEFCNKSFERFFSRIPSICHAYVMKHFIDESHRVEFACRNAFFVFVPFIEKRIQFFGKDAHLVYVGENYIA